LAEYAMVGKSSSFFLGGLTGIFATSRLVFWASLHSLTLYFGRRIGWKRFRFSSLGRITIFTSNIAMYSLAGVRGL
ncbi:MAG: hypothetical protein P8Z42_09315, partial [Anaerolineales bacterium]